MKNSALKIGIITQARMTSTRLLGKIFKEINGISILQYHIDRLQQTGFDISIATTSNKTDYCVEEFANTNKIGIYRGSENNVLSRFHGAAIKYSYDIIVRVTSDCPLIDPHLIRNAVEKYIQLNNPQTYLSNCIERTFSRGFDFEVFSFQLLDEAFQKATSTEDLEHVTPYIWKNKSGKVSFYHIKQNEDNSHLRITVDTADDFELIKQLIEKHKAQQLPYNEIESILTNSPELVKVNAHINQKKV